MHEPLVELTRGRLVESSHSGSIAVADAAGCRVASSGDPDAVVFLRSSAKPFQALLLIESGAADAFGLEEREVAIACSSHTGTDTHVAAVQSLQRKAGLSEADLLCGVHPPVDRGTWREMIRRGEESTPLRHNCSGKHSGMLAVARHQWGSVLSPEGIPYIEASGPVQQDILQIFADMCGVPAEQIEVGTDGCSVPNFAVPLQAAATAAARLMDPKGLTSVRADACRRIVRAMTAHPELIRGAGRFDTELMLAGEGDIVSKTGAEGYQLIGLAAGVRGPNSRALGIAIKITDGDGEGRAAGMVGLQVLSQLGWQLSTEAPGLDAYRPRVLVNWRGLAVGEIRTCFSLSCV